MGPPVMPVATYDRDARPPASADAPAAVAIRTPERGKRRLARLLGPPAILAIATLALLALWRELRAYRLTDVLRQVRDLRPQTIGLAVVVTACGYLALSGYDALALRYVGRRVHARRIVLASFIAYAFSQTISLSALTGASIRYRFWSAWGLSTAEIARAVAFTVATLWLGAFTLGGAALVLEPGVVSSAIPALSVGVARAIGSVLLGLVVMHLIWAIVVRRPLRVGGWRIEGPDPRLALAQVSIATLDWTLAGLVLYILLRDAAPLPFAGFLGLFILAQVIGLASHVPGGLGVFETAMVLLLEPRMPPSAVLGALVAYRAIYYLLPLTIAAVILLTHELLRQRAHLTRLAGTAGQLISPLAPHLLSGSAFVAGVILLVSGVTPADPIRLVWLSDVFPLAVIELAHLAASVAGITLVLVALSLRRRLDAAYQLAVVALAVGIVASLLKGVDWEEALALAVVLVTLIPAHRHFYRRAALTAEPFTPGWLVAIALVLGGVLWLGLFSYKHVEYAGELWWRFALSGDAPRFLRATAAVVAAVVAFAFAHLLRPAPARPASPTPTALHCAADIAARSERTDVWLALLGDKALLLSDSGRAFIMYAVAGRSWVALGDPAGAAAERAELAWRFRELADRHGGWTVFYQVGKEDLPLYVDLGLTLVKVGEEACVPLRGFSLEGGARKRLRRAHRDVEREGASFEVVPPVGVPMLIPELRRVSDDWLANKHTREKRFSIGFFDERYLRHFPVAVARVHGRIVAFANVLLSGTGTELSVDLMRYSSDAPHGVMDYLFTELMLWGSRDGYRSFNLGMAPLSGFAPRALAPLWSRAGAFVYGHGEHFYNFRGLRQYKEKFDPVWEPRYLASPGGLALPRILTNIATLVSGGLAGVVAR
jgi:phosphatidylglycerol lysyltransferase